MPCEQAPNGRVHTHGRGLAALCCQSNNSRSAPRLNGGLNGDSLYTVRPLSLPGSLYGSRCILALITWKPIAEANHEDNRDSMYYGRARFRAVRSGVLE